LVVEIVRRILAALLCRHNLEAVSQVRLVAIGSADVQISVGELA
jgi:hypothetical protein